jgi:hypothetical protein
VPAVGDFNADGYGVLTVGVPMEDVHVADYHAIDAGSVNVIYGSAVVRLRADYNRLRNEYTLGTNHEAADRFGAALASGDFDGDGYDDLAIGVPGEDFDALGGTVEDVGSVRIVFGSVDRLVTSGIQILFQGLEGPENEAEENDRFGWALAAGDVDCDGYDDLVIGTPYEHIGDVADAGMVQVFYGGSFGIPQEPRYDNLHQNKGSTAGTAEVEDRFGKAVAVLDAGPWKIYLPLVIRGAGGP